ncbi:unnamed protein product [Boreogadus saida]
MRSDWTARSERAEGEIERAERGIGGLRRGREREVRARGRHNALKAAQQERARWRGGARRQRSGAAMQIESDRGKWKSRPVALRLARIARSGGCEQRKREGMLGLDTEEHDGSSGRPGDAERSARVRVGSRGDGNEVGNPQPWSFPSMQIVAGISYPPFSPPSPT